jgi:hypothetical protein
MQFSEIKLTRADSIEQKEINLNELSLEKKTSVEE